MSKGTDLRASVLGVLTRLGESATLTHLTQTYDPTDGSVSTGTSAETVKAAPMADEKVIGPDGEQRRVHQAIIGAEGLASAPTVGDTLLMSSVTFLVRAVEAYTLTGVVVAYVVAEA